MPSYRIPSDDRVRDSLVRVLSTRPMVDSQRRLKQLVEKDLKGDEKYRVGEPRLRHLAIESGLVDLEIRCRDTDEMRSLIKCPVCGARLKKVRNMTVYGGTVTLGYRCERCKYWTGLKRRVDDLLYTSDFNPEGGSTCGRAQPEFVRDLIVDATYGRPGYNFPPKHDVESDLLNWLEMELAQGPVALGGYEFGKSQELIALVNRLGVEVAVSDKIADLADLYGAYGITLEYRRLSELAENERNDPRVYVLPPGWLRPPLEDSVSWLGSIGLKAAYVSGWCAFFDYTGRYGLDAQFPLSDHGDFEDVMTFIEACRPRKVYTAFSGAKDLAKAVDRRLKIRAEALLTR